MRTLLALALAIAFGSTALAQDIPKQVREACLRHEQTLIRAVLEKKKELGVRRPEDTGPPYQDFKYWFNNDGRAKCIEARIAQQATQQEDDYGRVEK